MAIGKGFKQTEVGVIPNDWQVCSIQEIGKPVRGGSPRPAGDPRFFEGTFIPWLTVAALTNIPSSQLKVSKTDSCLTEEGSLRSRILYPGTLILANSGATLGVAKILDIKCCANDGIAALLNFDLKISKTYLVHYINTRTQYLRDVVATGNGQPNLNTELIGNFKVPFPPTLCEQEAIAGALSDADAWIESLEQLIAKKRQVKQGAMQELLTGKRRLPGFSERWDRKRLGDIASLNRLNIVPQSFPTQKFYHYSLPAYDDGKTPVEELGSTIGSNKFIVPHGAVLVSKLNPRIPRVWAPDEIPEHSVASTEFLVLNPKENVSRQFLFTVCSSPRFCEQMELSATGTTGSHQRISPSGALAIQVSVPNDPGEQTTIATVLSDMDAEIGSLESKLAKAREVKHGMMQELLTGRIRLV